LQTKVERLDGIFFINADPRLGYAGQINDPQGGDVTMLMQQVREVITVNQELEDDQVGSRWLTSEQMGFTLRSEFAKGTRKPEVRNNAMTILLTGQHQMRGERRVCLVLGSPRLP